MNIWGNKLSLALLGKGGVGKTVVATIISKIFIERGGHKVLIIDADPAMSLPGTLGVPIKKTIGDIRNEIISNVRGSVGNDDKEELSRNLDYMVLEALVECRGFTLLALGHTEASGCFCPINNLLKSVIETISQSFDIIIIDGEAGLEQINRRVMRQVDFPIIVTDTSLRGIQTARIIKNLITRQEAIKDYKDMGLIINRANGKEGVVIKEAQEISLNVLGCIPEDDMVADFDALGKALINLPKDSLSVTEVKKILEKINLVES